jgi:CBS domain-containing protein
MATTTTQSTRVSEAMHRGVLTCSRDTPLLEVARTMAEQRVHCVVVRDGADPEGSSPPLGVVSDLDLVAAWTVRDLGDQSAGEAAASPVVTVTPQETLERAAQLMLEHGSDHLLVVDPADARPVGILSTLDVAATLSARMSLEEMSA